MQTVPDQASTKLASISYSPQADPKNTTAPGAIDLELHSRRYRARWAQLGTVEQLRVNVRIEAGSNGSTKMHVETLDLYSPRSRSVFASRAAKVMGVTVDAIEEDLSELLVAVDHAQRAAALAATAKPVGEPSPIMTDAERAEALQLLRAPDLMDRIARDMDAVGYVGEDINKKLGYLIAVSRKLAEPLSAILISQSGAGKSALATIIERLMPPEEVVFWSRLTPQALYYVEKDFLKRKLVVIEEREGSDAADYSIRALQSKHKLVQAVPVKDPATGSIHTRTMEVEGPAAFLETTTRYSINPENASRCFELYLDETPAQTMRIQAAQRTAKTAKGSQLRKRSHATERVHRNAQRLLDPVEVRIPYAEQLTYPASWLRTRRDNQRLLNLIEAITFLHQKRRTLKAESSGEQYVEATVEDYAIAYALAAEVLGLGLDELRKPVRDLLALLEEKIKELADSQGARAKAMSFTQRDVRSWSGLPHHQVKRVLRELEELEYVVVDRVARGSCATYHLVELNEKKRAPLTGLLTPVALHNLLSSSSSQSCEKSRSASAATKACPEPSRRVGQTGKRACSTTISE